MDAAEETLNISREDLPPLDLAGAMDSVVIKQLFSDAGRPLEPARIQLFHQSYLERIFARLHHADFCGRLLPGVQSLLESLAADSNFSIGLLTGNLRRGADMKLQRFQIAHHFITCMHSEIDRLITACIMPSHKLTSGVTSCEATRL